MYTHYRQVLKFFKLSLGLTCLASSGVLSHTWAHMGAKCLVTSECGNYSIYLLLEILMNRLKLV